MQKYLLGIDVGNTKTEHLLCTIEGEYVGIHNTASQLSSDNKKVVTVLKEQIAVLLERCNVDVGDITAVGIGIALTFSSDQTKEVIELVKKIIGIEVVYLNTDTGVGTYALWMGRGRGVYSFASTGDITMGLSLDNKWMIAGGTGLYSSDDASGSYIYKRAASLFYDHHFRCGKNSTMFPDLVSLLNLDLDDLRKSFKGVVGKPLKAKAKDIIKIIDNSALAGDEVAMDIFKDAGICSGMSTAGCIKSMVFKKEITENNPVKLILIGSIWNKILYDGMRESYFKTAQEFSGKACTMTILEAPPAVGSIFKVKEVLDGGERISEDYRAKVLESVAVGSTNDEIAALQTLESPNIELLQYLITTRKNKPQTAANFDIDEQICKITKKHPMINNISAGLTSLLFPAIRSILQKDYSKAFSQIVSASRYIDIAQDDIEAYNQLVIDCSKRVKNKEHHFRF